MSALRAQMQADLQLIGITPKTQHVYLREVGNFAKYFDKSPELLGETEVKEYLLYLLNKRHLSEGTFRYYVSGLKFLYRNTLKREDVVTDIKYPKRNKTLPVVLALPDVEALISGSEKR